MTPPTEYIPPAGRVSFCLDFLDWYDRPRLSSYLLHNSRNAWRLTTRQYPDGGTEWSVTPNRAADGWQDGRRCGLTNVEGVAERSDDSGAEAAPPFPQPRDYAGEASMRAKRSVKRLARNHGMVNMWTGTFPGAGVHDYDRAYRCVAGWIHHSGGEFFRLRGGYLGVFELHPSGHGWHVHVLFGGRRLSRAELRELQRSWSGYLRAQGLCEGYGGLVRHHVKRFSSARVAAAYAAKYVTKSFGGRAGVAGGRQRYVRSEGLVLPTGVASYHGSRYGALAAIPLHPRVWDRFYDGREGLGLPFDFVSADCDYRMIGIPPP